MTTHITTYIHNTHTHITTYIHNTHTHTYIMPQTAFTYLVMAAPHSGSNIAEDTHKHIHTHTHHFPINHTELLLHLVVADHCTDCNNIHTRAHVTYTYMFISRIYIYIYIYIYITTYTLYVYICI